MPCVSLPYSLNQNLNFGSQSLEYRLWPGSEIGRLEKGPTKVGTLTPVNIRTTSNIMSETKMSSGSPRRKRKIILGLLVLILALLICGVLYDLYFPRTTHLREFDPDEVARLETAMWRSYYYRTAYPIVATQLAASLIRSGTLLRSLPIADTFS